LIIDEYTSRLRLPGGALSAKGIDLLKKIAPPTYMNKAEEHQKSSNFYLQARLFVKLSGTRDFILIKTNGE